MPGTKIRLLFGTKIISGSKRIYCMDSLHIQNAGSISILRNSHPDQEGIKTPLTEKRFWNCGIFNFGGNPVTLAAIFHQISAGLIRLSGRHISY